MPTPMELWARVRSNKTVQLTVAYVVGAFAVLGIVDRLSHAFDWPHVVLHVVASGLALGVPVVAVLAWYHGHRALATATGSDLVVMSLPLIAVGALWGVLAADIILSRSDRALAHYLVNRDPAIFSKEPQADRYNIARVLIDQNALTSEADFGQEIDGTKVSFDFLGNTGGRVFRSNRDQFIALVKRGVNVRILLSDYSRDNRPDFDSFARAVGDDSVLAIKDDSVVSLWIRQLAATAAKDRTVYRGSVELRWFVKPLFYTMWIRDGRSDNGIAHLGVHMYRGKSKWPAFRFGNMSLPMVASLQDEYDSVWSHAKQPPALP